VLEAVVTGWHLLSGKEREEGAMKIHRDRSSDAIRAAKDPPLRGHGHLRYWSGR
jgi:hypothetical protein